MDNNQSSQAAPEPTVIPTPAVATEAPKGGGNKIVMVIIIAVILALVLGGVYWIISGQNKEAPTTQTQNVTQETNGVDSLEKDLNSSQLDDLDTEFSSVDSDLKSL